MADVCGPFSLEDLDRFGNLDSLAFSLDSGVWDTACIYDGSASVDGLASTSGAGIRNRTSSASVSAFAASTLNAYRNRSSSASVSASGSVSIDYYRTRTSSASISTDSSTSALGGMAFSGIANLVASSNAYAQLYGALSSSGSAYVQGSVLCNGRIIGEDWINVPASSNTWTPV